MNDTSKAQKFKVNEIERTKDCLIFRGKNGRNIPEVFNIPHQHPETKNELLCSIPCGTIIQREYQPGSRIIQAMHFLDSKKTIPIS